MSVKRILEEYVPSFPRPKEELEQYRTPPELAIELASFALANGCDNGVTADFGSGTGMIMYALALYGFNYVVGLDIDSEASTSAKQSILYTLLANIDLVVADARRPPLRRVDCVVQNPPFGIKRRGADFEFVRSALALKPSILVSLHSFNEKSLKLLEELCSVEGFKLRLVEKKRFPIKYMYNFHRRRIHYIWVAVVVCLRQGMSRE